ADAVGIDDVQATAFRTNDLASLDGVLQRHDLGCIRVALQHDGEEGAGISLGLFGKRIALDDRAPFLRGADEEIGLDPEALGRRFFELSLQLVVRRLAAEYDIAAL